MIKKCVDCGKEITKKATRCNSYAKRGKRDPNKIRRGAKSHAWKGGRYRDSKGYIHIYKHDHPRATGRGYVFEHRLIVEKALGRYLKADEFVHHINGVRDDNRLENLELLDNHRRQICPQCGWPLSNLLLARARENE